MDSDDIASANLKNNLLGTWVLMAGLSLFWEVVRKIGDGTTAGQASRECSLKMKAGNL